MNFETGSAQLHLLVQFPVLNISDTIRDEHLVMRQKEFIFCLQRNLLSPHVSLHCSGEMLAGRKRGEELDLSFATVLPELLLPGLHSFFLPIMGTRRLRTTAILLLSKFINLGVSKGGACIQKPVFRILNSFKLLV